MSFAMMWYIRDNHCIQFGSSGTGHTCIRKIEGMVLCCIMCRKLSKGQERE